MKIDDSGTSHRRVGAENRFKVRAVRRRGEARPPAVGAGAELRAAQ